jgi:hypothetical protein
VSIAETTQKKLDIVKPANVYLHVILWWAVIRVIKISHNSIGLYYASYKNRTEQLHDMLVCVIDAGV